MANANTQRGQHPVSQKGFIGRCIDAIFKLLGLLIFSAFVSIMIEWIGMAFFYEKKGDSGHAHAEAMMKKEMAYLNIPENESNLNNSAIHSVNQYILKTIKYLFIHSGIIERLISAKTFQPDDGRLKRLFKSLVAEYYDYLMAAIYILILFFIRLSILILSLPTFLLFGLVGVTDGLMQRDLRRWCGGNESGYVYHWAKRFAIPVLLLSWLIYLAMPSSVHPNYIITPFAVLFGLVLMVMMSTFKKYL